MSSYNRVILMGNLTREPELRHTQSGMAVCEINIAVNDKTKKEERCDYFTGTAWDKKAEICAQYLTKGSEVLIEGKLRNETWDAKDGTKKSKTRIAIDNIKFVKIKERDAQHKQSFGDAGMNSEEHGNGDPSESIPDDIPF